MRGLTSLIKICIKIKSVNICRYTGGKYRLGKYISASILDYEKRYDELHGTGEPRPYFEPFVGMGGVMREIPETRIRKGTDLNPDVVGMWSSLQTGWIPPLEVTEELYNHVRDEVPMGDPRRGIIGFGASYSGYYFSKFMPTVYPGSRRNVMKFYPKMASVEFLESKSYENYLDIENHMIYCDPPYAGSTGNTGKKSRFLNQFDNEKFWEDMRQLCKKNLVFISEGSAPSDFHQIWEKEVITRMAGKGIEKRKTRYERVFVHESQII